MTIVQIASVFVLIISSVTTNSNSAKIVELKWNKHYDSAKLEAQKAKRPLVVVIEKPDNSNEKIDETKLTSKERETITKEKFELVRVDATTDYGKKVARAFGAKKFPYTAVTDDKSIRIVYRKEGQMSQRDWTVALAKCVKSKLESTKHEVKKVVVSAGPIVWQGDLAKAQLQASSEGRPVFLYLTAPGCTYCEVMKADAFTKPWIIDDMKANFVTVQVDGRARRDISERFGVRMYPTLVILTPHGEVVEQWNGYTNLQDFEAHMTMAKSKLAL